MPPFLFHIGRMKKLQIELNPATSKDVVLENIASSKQRQTPFIQLQQAHDKEVFICGNAPSIKSNIDKITGEVWAINGAYDYLIGQGIVADVHFLWDASELLLNYIENKNTKTRYLLASHCSPKLFDALEGYNVEIFHAEIGHDIECKEQPIFHGGCAGCTRAPFIAYGLGYRKIHILGADASYGEQSHINRDDSEVVDVDVMDVTLGGKTYKTAAWMAQQAYELPKIVNALKGAQLIVYGDGLFPHAAKMCGVHYEQLNKLGKI